MKQLNKHFLDRMKKLLGEDYPAFVEAMDKPMQKAVFVNTNKIDLDRFAGIVDFALCPIPYEKQGFYVNIDKVGKHPLHLAGAFYSQEPSAMFTVNAIKFKGNERVLDMCASPGGKTIQLANRLKDGLVLANEINFARSKILYSNVERMGLKNVVVTNNSPTEIATAFANCFDVCLVDAPCSAEGMFRRDEKYIDNWNENLPKMCQARQLEILKEADRCLKQGGKLIYSTCTYSLEENEQVVEEFLKKYNYKLMNIDSELPRGVGKKECVRMYPHKVMGEGQFVAVFEKKAGNFEQEGKNVRLLLDKQFYKFAQENLKIKLEAWKYLNYSYFVIDANLIKNGINYISIGVKLGEWNKFGFVPDHYMFSAFGRDFKRTIELEFNSVEAKKFLHGEELMSDFDDGFGAVLIEGCPAGGFKSSKGKLKNHLPKGLRI